MIKNVTNPTVAVCFTLFILLLLMSDNMNVNSFKESFTNNEKRIRDYRVLIQQKVRNPTFILSRIKNFSEKEASKIPKSVKQKVRDEIEKSEK